MQIERKLLVFDLGRESRTVCNLGGDVPYAWSWFEKSLKVVIRGLRVDTLRWQKLWTGCLPGFWSELTTVLWLRSFWRAWTNFKVVGTYSWRKWPVVWTTATKRRQTSELVYSRLPVATEESYFPRLPDPSLIGYRSRAQKMRKEAVARTKAQIKQLVYYNRSRTSQKVPHFILISKQHYI